MTHYYLWLFLLGGTIALFGASRGIMSYLIRDARKCYIFSGLITLFGLNVVILGVYLILGHLRPEDTSLVLNRPVLVVVCLIMNLICLFILHYISSRRFPKMNNTGSAR